MPRHRMCIVGFVRKWRVVLHNVNETLSAFWLGNAETWHQLFTDGNSWRKIDFQNIVISLMENGGLDLVIVSSCMYVEDGILEKCVESILETVSSILCHEYLFVYHSSLTKSSDIISVTIQLTKLNLHLQRWKKLPQESSLIDTISLLWFHRCKWWFSLVSWIVTEIISDDFVRDESYIERY